MQTSPAKEVLTSPIRIRNFALSAALGQSGLLAGGAGKSKQQRRGKQVISTGLVNGPQTNGEACEPNLQVIGAQAKREQAKSINVTNGNSNGNGSCGLSIVGGGGILARQIVPYPLYPVLMGGGAFLLATAMLVSARVSRVAFGPSNL